MLKWEWLKSKCLPKKLLSRSFLANSVYYLWMVIEWKFLCYCAEAMLVMTVITWPFHGTSLSSDWLCGFACRTLPASARTYSRPGGITALSDGLFLTTYPQYAVVRAMLLSEAYAIILNNRLQYLYFVGFVNLIHHKPPWSSSIFLTHHLVEVRPPWSFQWTILLAKCRFPTIYHRKCVHLSIHNKYNTCYLSTAW